VASAYRRVPDQAVAPHTGMRDSLVATATVRGLLLSPTDRPGMDPVHPDDARPGHGDPKDGWVDIGGGDRRDRDTHDHRDNGQGQLPCPTALLDRLRPAGLVGLPPEFRGTGLGKILYPLSEVGGDRFGILRPKFHPGCQRRLGVAS